MKKLLLFHSSRFTLFAVLISLAGAGIAIYQSFQNTSLIDYAYQVENSYRIFQGQMPYKDFFLVLPPGTYYITALIMKIFGGYSHFSLQLFVIGISFFMPLLLSQTLKLIFKQNFFLILIITPLLFTGQSLYPYISYDVLITLLISVYIYIELLLRDKKIAKGLSFVLRGFIAFIPYLFKQNTGIAFFVGVEIIYLIIFIKNKKKANFYSFLLFSLGGLIGFAFFGVWLYINNALEPFIFQTMTFPNQSRMPLDALRIVFQQYADVMKYGGVILVIIFTSIISLLPFLIRKLKIVSDYMANILLRFSATTAICLLSIICILLLLSVEQKILYKQTILVFSVFLYIASIISLSFFILQKRENVFFHLLAIPLILSNHATYLSHHVVGSSYTLWPQFILLLAGAAKLSSRVVSFIFLLLIPVICFVSIVLFRELYSKRFYDFVITYDLKQTATHKKIRGLTVEGNHIKDMEYLFDYVQKNIPKDDLVAFLPGEVPFYAVTQRKNPLPFSQLHQQTYYVNWDSLISMIATSGAKWLIIKTEWQLFPYYGLVNLEDPRTNLSKYFSLFKSLPSYNVYVLK